MILLTGCVSIGPAPVAPGPVVSIRFDTGGIEAVGTGQRIDFGRDRAGVIETMTRLQGSAPTPLPCDDSRRAAYRWQDGPLLVFRDDDFVGWSTPDLAQSATGAGTQGLSCTPISPV
ncbi:hypothetical protein [Gymnodinialimonas sp.]